MKSLAAVVTLALLLNAGCATQHAAAPATDTNTVIAVRVSRDFAVDGDAAKSIWKKAPPVTLHHGSRDALSHPELATKVSALWSKNFLYLLYECPFTELTVFEPVRIEERFGLWERDVVEAFIGTDSANIRRYTEYEVSPTNERLDVKLPEKDFAWSSGFESATHIDREHHRWTAEFRIPLTALSDSAPRAGTRWRINLYRCDYANRAFLAFKPTLTGTFHAPERFGVLEFR